MPWGAHQDVETTTGIKQGCKLYTFFRVNGQTPTRPYRHIWLGHCPEIFHGIRCDDFTMHRIIRSQADLAAAHKLILRLLDAVRALKLKVNQAKCAMLVKLCGREAQRVLQKHTCWLPTRMVSFSAIGGWDSANPGLHTGGKPRLNT